MVEEEVVQKEEEDCGDALVAVESGGRDVKLDLSIIGQVLSKQPDPLVYSPPILSWPMRQSAPHHRMHFPLPKYRNQAFLDAQQWAVAFAVFSSSNPSQVEFKHKFACNIFIHYTVHLGGFRMFFKARGDHLQPAARWGQRSG